MPQVYATCSPGAGIVEGGSGIRVEDLADPRHTSSPKAVIERSTMSWPAPGDPSPGWLRSMQLKQTL